LNVLLVLVNSVLAEAERFYGDLFSGLTALPAYLTANGPHNEQYVWCTLLYTCFDPYLFTKLRKRRTDCLVALVAATEKSTFVAR
jgi:hypothetical protein